MARLMLAAFIVGAVLLTESAALADGIGILPTTVQIDATHRIATVTIVNNDPVLHTFQITPFAWSQVDGHDSLTPTTDLLVSPPIFTVIASGQQAVRFALRNAAPVASELTFRIMLRTAPTDTVVLNSGTRMRVGFSLPVFIASPQGGTPKLTCSSRELEHNRIALTLQNTGTAHVHLVRLRLADERGTAVDAPMAQYILAETRTVLNLSAARPLKGDTINAKMTFDQGPPVDVAVHRAG